VLPKWGEQVKPVEIQTRAVERAPLRLSDPEPVRFRDLEWTVVTPDNIEKVWADLRAKNVDLVLFALTDDGYESLALDFAAIRRYIVMQREVAQKYRDYYEPKSNDDKK
jgi:hypothetical protein